MRSNSFKTLGVREVDRKNVGLTRDFPILCMEIIEEHFQMEERNSKTRKGCRNEEEDLCQNELKSSATLPVSVAVEEKLVATARNLVEVRENRKRNETLRQQARWQSQEV